MRILQVNKYGSATSGADNYCLSVSARLLERGHEVGILCTRPVDLPDGAVPYVVSDVEFHGRKTIWASAGMAMRVCHSSEAGRVMEGAVSEFRPDVVHAHNYAHQLSSSVIQAARNGGIRTVATAHDYKVICPSYLAVRAGKECFQCASGSPLNCVTGRCLHGSVGWSSVAALEAQLVRLSSSRIPEIILAPSVYMADHLKDSWLQKRHVDIRVLRNPVVQGGEIRFQERAAHAVLYVGRLVPEKGLEVLISASAAANLPLIVVGDGPHRASLERVATSHGAPVEFRGYLTGQALSASWNEARVFAMTPTWPENAPLTVLEALARGVPSVISRTGGLPELVDAYGGGLVVDPGDIDATADALLAAWNGQVPKLEREGFGMATSWDAHMCELEQIYAGDSACG